MKNLHIEHITSYFSPCPVIKYMDFSTLIKKS